MYKTTELFDLSRSVAGSAVAKFDSAYLAVSAIEDIIADTASGIASGEYTRTDSGALVSRSARISDGAFIGENVIICEGAEIRQGAFIRKNAIIGAHAVIGNSCEIKNSIIFDEAQIPHFNYVGDSIIGWRAHLGAGVICSNLRSDKTSVKIRSESEIIDTGMKKLGAIVGDFAEIGCNSVLCPGSVIGKCAVVYPLSLVRTQIAEKSVFKGERA